MKEKELLPPVLFKNKQFCMVPPFCNTSGADRSVYEKVHERINLQMKFPEIVLKVKFELVIAVVDHALLNWTRSIRI